VQTLYRHFPNKESLAVAVDWYWFDRFKELVESRDRQARSFIAFWREWIVSTSARGKRDPDLLRTRLLIKERVPAVAGLSVAVWNAYIDLLTNEIAADLAVDPTTNAYPQLFASMLWAGNHASARRWARDSKRDVQADAVAVVDGVAHLIELWRGALSAGGKSRAKVVRRAVRV